MRVFCACIDFQVAEKGRSEAVFGQHPFDCFFDEEGRFLSQVIGGGGIALTARIAGVAGVDLIGHLFPRETYFVCVDDDDVVTAVNVGSVAGFVLTAQDFGYLRSESAQRCVCRVDEVPLFVGSLSVDRNSFVA